VIKEREGRGGEGKGGERMKGNGGKGMRWTEPQKQILSTALVMSMQKSPEWGYIDH
jgi:hypothetical protein